MAKSREELLTSLACEYLRLIQESKHMTSTQRNSLVCAASVVKIMQKSGQSHAGKVVPPPHCARWDWPNLTDGK